MVTSITLSQLAKEVFFHNQCLPLNRISYIFITYTNIHIQIFITWFSMQSGLLTIFQIRSFHFFLFFLRSGCLCNSFFSNLFIYLFIYLFLAALGLHCCAGAFLSSCSKWGLLFVAERGLLIAVASLVVEHGF